MKNVTRNKWIVLVATLAPLAGLVACGSGSTPTAAPASTAPTATPTAAPTPKPTPKPAITTPAPAPVVVRPPCPSGYTNYGSAASPNCILVLVWNSSTDVVVSAYSQCPPGLVQFKIDPSTGGRRCLSPAQVAPAPAPAPTHTYLTNPCFPGSTNPDCGQIPVPTPTPPPSSSRFPLLARDDELRNGGEASVLRH